MRFIFSVVGVHPTSKRQVVRQTELTAFQVKTMLDAMEGHGKKLNSAGLVSVALDLGGATERMRGVMLAVGKLRG